MRSPALMPMKRSNLTVTVIIGPPKKQMNTPMQISTAPSIYSGTYYSFKSVISSLISFTSTANYYAGFGDGSDGAFGTTVDAGPAGAA